MGPLKVALLATVLAASTAAQAQEAGPSKAADPRAEAAVHYREGVAAFDAGRFADALAAFTEAYNLSSETDLLYNLGVCSEKVGDREKAIAYYQLYLEEKPDAADAAEVKARLEALKAGPAAAPPTPSPAAGKAPAPVPSVDADGVGTVAEGAADEGKRNPNIGPALLMGLGGLVVVTGALTAASAYKSYKDLESTCSPDCSGGKVDAVKRVALAADIQFAVGGATVAAGFLWWLLKTRHEEGAAVGTGVTARISASPFAAADGGGVLLEGRF
jgi:tetratricopeptide (TPR) repeat protein